MAALWMRETAPTDRAGSTDSTRSQEIPRQDSAHRGLSQDGRDGSGGRVLRVLVVDDARDTTNSLADRVRRWGHATLMADDGPTALRVAATGNPDVVLLNLAMPFMEGCQVARQLRLDRPGGDCLIIACAGQADDERRRQYTEAGIDLLLIKPVDPAVVETLLLLECVRANRLPTDDAARRTSKASSQLTGKKRQDVASDGAANALRPRLARGIRAGDMPTRVLVDYTCQSTS